MKVLLKNVPIRFLLSLVFSLAIFGYYTNLGYGIKTNAYFTYNQRSRFKVEDLVRYVDPFIGTGGNGHTFPGPSAPFGKVQPGPDNGADGWSWTSGYHYSSDSIFGFSNTHLSGTGIADLMDVTMMPLCLSHNEMGDTGFKEYLQDLLVVEASITTPQLRKQYPKKFDKESLRKLLASNFSHHQETASPGYYSVQLKKHGILVELTAGSDVGMHRYSLSQNHLCDEHIVAVDLSTIHYRSGVSRNADMQVGRKTADDTSHHHSITGHRVTNAWARNRSLYFHIEFSKPIVDYYILNNTNSSLDWKQCTGSGCHVAFLKFNDIDGLQARIGMSSVGPQGASKALEKSHSAFGFDFDTMKASTESLWQETLSKIRVFGGSSSVRKIFYTAMYHAFLAPTVHSDADGSFRGPDRATHSAKQHIYYSTLSIWDTFRAQYAFLTILDRQVSHDIAMTMIEHASLFRNQLPIWALAGIETLTMPGYHAVSFLAEAIKKGILEHKHLDKILVAADKTAQRFSTLSPRVHIDRYGYVPSDAAHESVTKTLEFAFYDWCIAEMAKAAGKVELESYYKNRSRYYRNVFDAETGFMRPRQKSGAFLQDFDPSYSEHGTGHFTEATAWQYLWFVPHDVDGLVELLGGRKKTEEKLDEFFFPSQNASIHGNKSSVDISGILGHYAHGNEPGHHTAYLYNLIGSPKKTQYLTRRLLHTMYHPHADGIIGNDDCGQMSAWFVLSSIGLYPVNPADGIYQITSPLFERTEIEIPPTSANNNTKDSVFVIEAPGAESHEYMYITKAVLYGSEGNQKRTIFSKTTDKLEITHDEIMAGGSLQLTLTSMSSTPFSHD